jgi:aromatic-L-amino-acid/L-tryptophan decarboxylase
VVFRFRSPGLSAAELDVQNARILEAVNATREVYLSHTRVRGRYAMRVAIGNIHTTETHVRRAFELIKDAIPA